MAPRDPAGSRTAPNRPAISLIIPTLNEARRIRTTLLTAHERANGASFEAIVVDGGSRDGTRRAAEPLARVLQSAPGRARQLNRGSRAAAGEVLLYCHADTLLPPDYGRRILAALDQPQVVGGAFQPRYSSDHTLLRLAERVLRLETRFLMFGDQALFARRAALEAIGFYAEVEIMEDVRLVHDLARQGRLVRLSAEVVTSARRFHARGVFRQLSLDLILLSAYYLGAPPAALARFYPQDPHAEAGER